MMTVKELVDICISICKTYEGVRIRKGNHNEIDETPYVDTSIAQYKSNAEYRKWDDIEVFSWSVFGDIIDIVIKR